MNIDQLKYLVDLAKTSSMNTTAKRMFISQQALSESMKRLEKELDCTLLTRSKTGVDFTEDGMAILESAQHILEHYQVMMNYLEARHHKEHLKGKITLGIAPVAVGSFLPELLQQFQTHYPDVTLYVQEHATDHIVYLLEQDEIDFGIFNYTESDVDQARFAPDILQNIFQFEQLYSDSLVCTMYKNNPLATTAFISQESLEQLKYTRYANTSYAKPEGLCLHISNNINIHQQFMREEGTVCCIPYQLFHTLYSSKEFHCIPIENAKPVICCLAYKKDSPLTGTAIQKLFIDTVHSVVPKT